MSNEYINFSYDPSKNGFSTSEWHSLYGTVSVSGGKLLFNKSAIIHYGDILRGDISFSMNIPAPATGIDTRFGLTLYSKGAYILFSINDTTLTATSSDGTNITSVGIDWQDSWTDADTVFRIKWEAGMVSFFVAGNLEACINDISVSGDPMSLYVIADGEDETTLNYITIKGVQSYVMSEGNDDSTFEPYVRTYDRLTIQDVPVVSTTISVDKYDSIGISESKSTSNPA
ncbi:MAG: hypothetical protein WC069_06000 [Candidatus Shapirobacteria bacterium]